MLGWGVGGIEAEAAMLGQPVSMLLPEVIGFRLTGKLKEGVTATDLVLTVTQMLRKKGVVGKFVEFFGPGLSDMTLADRATIGNMAPEYGATCGFFPVDSETIRYLDHVRPQAENRIALVEEYSKAQGMWRDTGSADPVFTDMLELDLGTSCRRWPVPSGRKAALRWKASQAGFATAMETEYKKAGEIGQRYAVEGKNYDLGHGDVVIAAITSCTNTSNPSVLIGRRAAGPQRQPAGLKTEAMGQDLAGARQPGRRRISGQIRACRRNSTSSGSTSSASAAPPASAIPGRCRRRNLEGDQRQGPRLPPRCCPATATSKAASSPTCRRTISPRRRWSLPMRWPAR